MSDIKEKTETNFVRVAGVVEETPKVCYKDRGEIFYETIISVPRKNSEVIDHIPVILSKKRRRQNIKKDDKIYLRGEIRKYRIPDEKGVITAKTGIFVFEILFVNEINFINEVILEGTLVKEPFYKENDNKKFTTLILDVSRKYEHSDYISVYAIEERAEKIKGMQIDQKIKIKGRIQSRVVPEKGMTFYEVFIKRFL